MVIDGDADGSTPEQKNLSGTPPRQPDMRPSRRTLLGALTAGAAGFGAGAVLGKTSLDGGEQHYSDSVGTASSQALEPIAATGKHQAGIAAPSTPQPFSLTFVADIPDVADISFLPSIGEALLSFLDSAEPQPGDLTVTVGIGPRVVAGVDGSLAGANDLPTFAKDTGLAPGRVGGDLLLIASASDPTTLWPAVEALLEPVGGYQERWRQFGFRGPGRDGIVRNPFGFHDGIMMPRGRDELDENVWLDGDERTAGGTIAVIRRLRMDVAAFGQLSVEKQEELVGRRKSDGTPLSGGEPRSEVRLTAKTSDGHYLTPVGSHARAAHPAPTGSALMLRRGYAYADGEEVGLVFTCFQRDLRTFVATQQRIDERDEMMRFVMPTASASFLVLPGFDGERPLGSTLLSRS